MAFVSSSWESRSEQPDRESRPLKTWLSDAEEIRPWRDAGEIDVGPQDHNVIFKFSCGTRAEKFITDRIEQR
jgi:hypothetical protein